MNADGTITVAANTPPGAYNYPYKICSNVTPTECDSAIAIVRVGSAVDAVNDDFGTVTGGGTTASVLGNDTLNADPATLANITLTPGTSPNAGLVMNADGTITIAPNTPSGTYSYPYQICSKVDPAVCDTAIAIVRVGSAVDAVNDDFGTVTGGATTASVLGNDNLDGNPAALATITLKPGTSPNPGLAMDLDGTITIALKTPPGTYNYSYTICSKVDPLVCDTAIATVNVGLGITAVDDHLGTVRGGGTTASVFAGDTLNGQPVTIDSVTLTPGTSPNPGIVMNPDGTVTVAANTPSGTYSYPYEICSKTVATVCKTAIATLVIGEKVTLPVTGADIGRLLLLSSGFVLAGITLARLARRRKRRATRSLPV
jgi:hypothetical protein